MCGHASDLKRPTGGSLASGLSPAWLDRMALPPPGLADLVAALAHTPRAPIAHCFFSRDRLHFSINEANCDHAVLPMFHNTVYHVPYAIPCPNYTHIQSRGCVLPAAHPDPSPPRTRTRTRTHSRAHRRSHRHPHVSRHRREC